jgi:hypothetical protein
VPVDCYSNMRPQMVCCVHERKARNRHNLHPLPDKLSSAQRFRERTEVRSQNRALNRKLLVAAKHRGRQVLQRVLLWLLRCAIVNAFKLPPFKHCNPSKRVLAHTTRVRLPNATRTCHHAMFPTENSLKHCNLINPLSKHTTLETAHSRTSSAFSWKR